MPSASTRARRWQATKGALITETFIGLNLLIFIIGTAINGRMLAGETTQLQVDLGLNGILLSQGPGQWYRIFTSGFIHFGLIHLGFNMYLLFQLGGMLESAIGRLRFALVYVACIAGGSAGAMLLQPLGLHGGASGAVFGLMGLAAVAYQQRGINPMRTQIGSLLLMNLAITFIVPGISIGGHLGGAITGGLCALVVLPRRPAAQSRQLQPFILIAIAFAAAAVTLFAIR